MSNSTKRAARQLGPKPPKPRPDYPLYAHATGKWCKTIQGKAIYFGRWDDPDGAEREYEEYVAAQGGNGKPAGTTLKDLCNCFYASKKMKYEAGALSPRSLAECDDVCLMLIKAFGGGRLVADLGPADFMRLGAKLGYFAPTTRGVRIIKIRGVFLYAYENDLIENPIKFGTDFEVPEKRVRDKYRNDKERDNGEKTFQAREIRAMADAAGVQLRAMILLGINAGFGNNDVATLPTGALDLQGGFATYPRPKTAVRRRAALWGETIAALREAAEGRPKARHARDAHLAFLTKFGQPWMRTEVKEKWRLGATRTVVVCANPLSNAFNTLLRELDIKRPGVSFYALRHTFATVAGGCKDQVAINFIMGHSDASVPAMYRHGIEDGRLRAVADHVHEWLCPTDMIGR